MSTLTREQVYEHIHEIIHNSGVFMPLEEELLCSVVTCFSHYDFAEDQQEEHNHNSQVVSIAFGLRSEQTCIRCGDQKIERTLSWNVAHREEEEPKL
jgi:hypothetical protein